MSDSAPPSGPRPVVEPIPQQGGPDRAERYLEIETKLEAEATFQVPPLADHPRLRELGAASVTAPAERELDAVYYDTDRLDLLHARVTLRRRTGGDDAGWHLKLPAGAGARTELRLPLSGNGSGGDDVPDGLAELVRGAARGRPLRPVARLRTRRTARHVLDAAGTPLVEIADDDVTALALVPEGAQEQRWRELEVEIEAGTPDLLNAVVAALLAAGARVSASASKVGRLLDPGAARPAEPSSPTALPAAVAVANYLRRQRDLLIGADIAIRSGDLDPEAPHSARTAIRRIRAILAVAHRMLPGDLTDELAVRLAQIGRAISDVRDLDVVRGRFEAWSDVRRDPDEAAVESSRRIRERLAAMRNDRSRALLRLLESTGYLQLLRDMDALVTDTATRPAASVADALAGPIDEAQSRLADHARRALALLAATDEHPEVYDSRRDALMHRIRKDAKTVRYAADAAAGAGGETGAAMADLAASLEQVQDVLGAHQDAVTAIATARAIDSESGLDPSLRRVLQGWWQHETSERVRALTQFAELWPALWIGSGVDPTGGPGDPPSGRSGGQHGGG